MSNISTKERAFWGEEINSAKEGRCGEFENMMKSDTCQQTDDAGLSPDWNEGWSTNREGFVRM